MRPLGFLVGLPLIGFSIGTLWNQSYSVPVDFEVSKGTNLAFDISPDGDTLVFDLLGQLWKLPVRGGKARPLTQAVRDTAEDFDPVYSPDGRWIVFQSDRPGGKGLWLITADGGEARRLTPETRSVDQYTHLQPTWSRDSREVFYAWGNRIYRIDVAAGTEERMTLDPPTGGERITGIGTPEVSPQGRSIAFGSGAQRAFRLSVGETARLWEAPTDGGAPRPLTSEQTKAVTPAYSPDGRNLAFFAPDSTGRWQLWVKPHANDDADQLTNHEDMAIRRVRWTPDGSYLLYSADGGLWRIKPEGGEPVEIPFSARIQFERPTYTPRPVRFRDASDEQPARGFYGLSLSPDGGSVAMLALGSIWVWDIGGAPRAVAQVPDGAYHLSWSGDGTEVVFTTGDLFAVRIASGSVRQLTALPGEERFPAWSPDDRHVAFIHDGPEVSASNRRLVRLIDAHGGVVEELEETTSLGRAPRGAWGGDEPVWLPDSKGMLFYGADLQGTTRAVFASLDGESHSAEPLPSSSSFVSWVAEDSVVYVRGAQLWSAAYDPEDGVIGEPKALSADPALYASAARDGSVLYLSGDGLRIRRPSGETEVLRWPLTYSAPPAPTSTLIRNVQVVDGTGSPPMPGQDLLLKGGRISRIAPTGTFDVDDSVRVIDADGRYVLPGLIDLHQHLWTPRPPVEGALYYGVTTVRDMGSSLAWSAGLRDWIDAGLRPGPRIVLGGSYFLSGVGLSKDAGLFLSGESQFERGIALVQGVGAIHAKYYLDGWAGLVSLVTAAHRQGIRVTGHCASSIVQAAAGIDGQEHSGNCARDEGRIYADYATIKKATGISVVVDPGQWRSRLRLWNEPETFSRLDFSSFLSESAKNANDPTRMSPVARGRVERAVERQRVRVAVMLEEGLRVAIGTDYNLPTDVHIQMAGLVEAGLSPLEAIAAATSVAASVLGADHAIGSVQEGKLADLVILDADPLADINSLRRVWQVIQGGRVVDRVALLEYASASPSLASGPSYGY